MALSFPMDRKLPSICSLEGMELKNVLSVSVTLTPCGQLRSVIEEDRLQEKVLLNLSTNRLAMEVGSLSSSLISPYRIVIILRLLILCFFFRFRILTPASDAFPLWLIKRAQSFSTGGAYLSDDGASMLLFDSLAETAEFARRWVPFSQSFSTGGAYVSDDGASMLLFDSLAETAEFARRWVPFCKKHNDELDKVRAGGDNSTEGLKESKNTCEKCGLTFKKAAYLKQHMLSHSTERPHVCPVDDCPSSYRRKDHLNRHLLIHKGKLFKCPIENCKSEFSVKANIKRHVEELYNEGRASPSTECENTERKHVCQEAGCGKAFAFSIKA
ncbi:hypothetical protein F8388_020320, partial [Cannabis sativa]